MNGTTVGDCMSVEYLLPRSGVVSAGGHISDSFACWIGRFFLNIVFEEHDAYVTI